MLRFSRAGSVRSLSVSGTARSVGRAAQIAAWYRGRWLAEEHERACWLRDRAAARPHKRAAEPFRARRIPIARGMTARTTSWYSGSRCRSGGLSITLAALRRAEARGVGARGACDDAQQHYPTSWSATAPDAGVDAQRHRTRGARGRRQRRQTTQAPGPNVRLLRFPTAEGSAALVSCVAAAP